jgi:hypothetical protein
MRLIMIATGCAAVAAVAVTLAVTPADAAKRKRVLVENQRVVVVPATRARPRVVVRGRSFLDAGTEVLPGEERKFTDYVYPPGYSALRNIDVYGGFRRQPLPDPFELPGARAWGGN